MNKGVHRTPSHPNQHNDYPIAGSSHPREICTDNVNRSVRGWPQLARIIADEPDLQSFPTFEDLCVKSLLYYQAELVYLRKELHEAEWDDYHRELGESTVFSLSCENLELSIMDRDEAIDNQEKPSKQWILIERIRMTLQKYHAALLQFSELATLRDADNCNIESLRRCAKISSPNGLAGMGADTWGDIIKTETAEPKSLPQLTWGLVTGIFVSPDPPRKQAEDVFKEHLIVPLKSSKPDGLTQWVKQSFIPWYKHLRENVVLHAYHWLRDHNLLPWVWFLSLWNFAVAFWGRFKHQQADLPRIEPEKGSPSISQRDPNGSTPMSPTSTLTNNGDASAAERIVKDMDHYSGSWIEKIASVITTVVACLLPVVAITVLSRVHSMGLILGLIAIFTAIFAVGLVILSSSTSRVDIFTATAAFSAVMVVFVQNQSSSG